ncbi:hypothetical protein XENTR_v10016106 [Xenopus tropicalis]|nr:hypothetical protein XENTR_v10016106 [Xenopus tropicalis]
MCCVPSLADWRAQSDMSLHAQGLSHRVCVTMLYIRFCMSVQYTDSIYHFSIKPIIRKSYQIRQCVNKFHKYRNKPEV